MMQNKFLFGITGGSGTGKTTVSKLFTDIFGFEVLDCDLISREVSSKGSNCLKELVNAFGDSILDNDGNLIRKKLGELAFKNEEKLKLLSEITHKYITAEIEKRVSSSKSEIIGIDGAVLIESGLGRILDKLVGVLASSEIRINRIIKRDSISEETAKNRINLQKIDKFFIENCDYIIYNNDELSVVEKKVREVGLRLAENAKELKRKNDFHS